MALALTRRQQNAYDGQKHTETILAEPCFPNCHTLMTQDDRLSPQSIDALRARFEAQSRKAQAYYTVMHSMRGKAGSDEAASAWMNEPLAQFDGSTPAQLVNEGREDAVLAYIASL